MYLSCDLVFHIKHNLQNTQISHIKFIVSAYLWYHSDNAYVKLISTNFVSIFMGSVQRSLIFIKVQFYMVRINVIYMDGLTWMIIKNIRFVLTAWRTRLVLQWMVVHFLRESLIRLEWFKKHCVYFDGVQEWLGFD